MIHYNVWMKGEYIGISPPSAELAIGTTCRSCNGEGKLQIGNVIEPKTRPCFSCDGSGWGTRQFVTVNIQVGEYVYKEKVLNEINAPSVYPARRPSRLYLIIRNIAGLGAHGDATATVADIREWMEKTPLPVPVTVMAEPSRLGYTLCVKHPTRAVLS